MTALLKDLALTQLDLSVDRGGLVMRKDNELSRWAIMLPLEPVGRCSCI